jgi:uracil phosphoribosyltransferase
MINHVMTAVIFTLALVSNIYGTEADVQRELFVNELIAKIQDNRDNEQELSELLPIVHCSFKPGTYEQILMTQLRDTRTSIEKFRATSEKLGALLVNKVIECLPTKTINIETPTAKCEGVVLASTIELVSIMRSGDALVDTFIKHFPDANVTKLLVQRNESTAKAHFIYMKDSLGLTSGNPVVITDPMIASGGTLEMAIAILKDKGVKEENIIVASICVAPEGIVRLNQQFPKIKVVMSSFDERVNEKKYIIPGLGDFGDRFFGTVAHDS